MWYIGMFFMVGETHKIQIFTLVYLLDNPKSKCNGCYKPKVEYYIKYRHFEF